MQVLGAPNKLLTTPVKILTANCGRDFFMPLKKAKSSQAPGFYFTGEVSYESKRQRNPKPHLR